MNCVKNKLKISGERSPPSKDGEMQHGAEKGEAALKCVRARCVWPKTACTPSDVLSEAFPEAAGDCGGEQASLTAPRSVGWGGFQVQTPDTIGSFFKFYFQIPQVFRHACTWTLCTWLLLGSVTNNKQQTTNNSSSFLLKLLS